jgi:hypothetical protein
LAVGDMIADWALVVGVIALVVLAWWVLQSFIDQMIEYWKAYRDDPRS